MPALPFAAFSWAAAPVHSPPTGSARQSWILSGLAGSDVSRERVRGYREVYLAESHKNSSKHNRVFGTVSCDSFGLGF